MSTERVDLPQGGEIRLLNYLGSDLDVVNAARISFGQQSQTYGETEDRILRFLMRDRHGSPFEHNYFRFYVKAPIFIFREWHRHRAGWSYNEMSGRYTQLLEECYVPEGDEIRERVGKPGSYTYQPIPEDREYERFSDQTGTTRTLYMREWVQDTISSSFERAYAEYTAMLEEGVAPEVARTVLPVGTFTQMVASCNARSLMHFLGLRAADTAQREIRAYAQRLEDALATVMPRTHHYFNEFGRVSP